jgi:ankyrin repeat protein
MSDLIDACRSGNPIALALLEEETTDIHARDDHDNTALIVACARGHSEIALALLQTDGIDFGINAQNIHGLTPLVHACARYS